VLGPMDQRAEDQQVQGTLEKGQPVGFFSGRHLTEV